jgi:hypothetical protein
MKPGPAPPCWVGSKRVSTSLRNDRGIAQPGSAAVLGTAGRWFESSCPDHDTELPAGKGAAIIGAGATCLNFQSQSGIPAGRALSMPVAFFENVESALLEFEDNADPIVLLVSDGNVDSAVLPAFEDGAEPTVFL